MDRETDGTRSVDVGTDVRCAVAVLTGRQQNLTGSLTRIGTDILQQLTELSLQSLLTAVAQSLLVLVLAVQHFHLLVDLLQFAGQIDFLLSFLRLKLTVGSLCVKLAQLVVHLTTCYCELVESHCLDFFHLQNVLKGY